MAPADHVEKQDLNVEVVHPIETLEKMETKTKTKALSKIEDKEKEEKKPPTRAQ